MKKEDFAGAFGDINEKHILEARAERKAKKPEWLKWGAMAACFALIIGLGIGGFNFRKDSSGGDIRNPTQHDTGTPDAAIDGPIISDDGYSEITDAGFAQWNGKSITLSLYNTLSDMKNKDSLIAISANFKIDTDFVYNGKSLAEYALEADAERLLCGKLGQLLKVGHSLKYGEDLYKTGTPAGEKWAKELYDKTVEFIGKDIIAKYIVDGEFLVDRLETDIAAYGKNEPCRIAYEEARNAFYRTAVDEAVKVLEEQHITYEKRNETELVFFITADDFASLSIDNASHFGLASKDGDDMDVIVDVSTDDFVIS